MQPIRLSRHAKRRIRLYKIEEKDVIDALQKVELHNEGKFDVIIEELKEKYKYPLKISYDVTENLIMVITAYPFKGKIK